MTIRLASCVLAICSLLRSQTRDLAQASLEDLMNIEVTSVSKKEQKLVTAAAAIYVITQEDIRRSGLNSIPEILRLVPGLDVAQLHNNQWAISSRGFNAQFAKKMLVLLDGRSVYKASNSGVYWNEQDPLIEDIERIEVIRGPGATLWGANAVNGVINIITKSAADTQGGLVSVSAGDVDKSLNAVRFGGRAGDLGYYRVYSTYNRREELESIPDNRRDVDWIAARGGFRADLNLSDRDALTIQGDLFRQTAAYDAKIPILTPPYQQIFASDVTSAGGNMMVNWSHRRSDRSVFTIRGYFDHDRQDDPTLQERDNTESIEFQHLWTLGKPERPRHEIVWGAGFRNNSSTFDNSPTIGFVNRSERLYSAFAQDQIHLVQDKLQLIAGLKFEHNDFTGAEIQPNVRLLWTISPRTSAWASLSRAVRTPSYFEEEARLNLAAFPTGGLPGLATLFGSHQFMDETLRAHEVGYRTQVKKRLSLDWTAFYNSYHHLGTYEPGQPFVSSAPAPLHLVFPSIAGNGLYGVSLGTEISATWDASKRWRIIGGYSWLDLKLHLYPWSKDTYNEPAEGQSPQHQIQVRSEFDLTPTIQFDANVFHITALPALAVPGYTRLDARFGWRPKSRPFEFSLGGQNLQGGEHLEYISEGPIAPSRVGRSFYGKAVWHF